MTLLAGRLRRVNASRGVQHPAALEGRAYEFQAAVRQLENGETIGAGRVPGRRIQHGKGRRAGGRDLTQESAGGLVIRERRKKLHKNPLGHQ